ncbi:hypothetical protein [Paraburkholderia sp. ZP32-5]|uniref:hypothetical protein n=1 Tax=Paraburkholderia sp. ZP32-5 TaxID=2883245 RepID=UPI001F36B24B|nr:hypothetical protein [Paraburkholderia sp. ZP32-5]
MIELTHRLLGLEEDLAKMVTAELSFRGLQNLSSSLVEERHPARFNEFREILKCVENSEAKRNVISHSRWGMGMCRTRNERVTVRTKYSAKQTKGLDFSREEMTLQDLRAISGEISIAAYDVEVFCSSLEGSDSTDD